MCIKCPKCHFDNPSDSKFCKECGTQIIPLVEIPVTETLETPKEDLTTGSTFAGRYQIIEELGKGGMGKVYKAIDNKLNEEVALKIIKPEIASDKKTLLRFNNELKLARKIAHKNVGRMYELMEEKGTHFITMEYVPGQDLRGLIRQSGQLAVGTAVSIAKQVCEGLNEAHRLGVIHRDLKPQNIMIDKEGMARIMDFGIARSVSGERITGAGVMVGTPEYMSPEQVESKEVDQHSDIYSLGVILYEMVTGQLPFEGDTALSIAIKHKGEMPKDPRKLNPQIPEDLSLVILKCLEKKREDRYQSTELTFSELSKIEQGIPTEERTKAKRKPITSKEITVTFGLKKLFIPAFVFIAIIAGGVIAWRILSERKAIPVIPSGKPSIAVMYFKNNTGKENLNHWRTMLSDLLIQDLFQSRYIRVLSEDRLLNILEELNQIEAKSYSSRVLKKVAVRGRVSHILQGNYAKAGDIFRINISLQDAATMELIASEGVEGKGEESIFTMVDELTKRIKTHFQLSEDEIASDIDREVGKITTSSPEAYKYFSEGKKYENEGKFRKSIQFMEKAVAIDPEFAMAYRSMAWSYNGLENRSRWKHYLQKALELSDRISDRERYLIQGDFFLQSENAFDKALESYNKLLQIYPEDVDLNLKLGEVFVLLEQWDKTIEQFEVLIQKKEDNPFIYTNTALAYMAKGFYDKAEAILLNYLRYFPDNAWIHYYLASNYMHQGKYNLALVESEKCSSIGPTNYFLLGIKGDIYRFRGDLDRAEYEYKKFLMEEEPLAHYWGRAWLASLYLLQGKFEKSKDQLIEGNKLGEKLGEKGGESGWYSELAYRHLRLGNPEEALKMSIKAEKSAVEWGCLYCHQKSALMYKSLSYLELESIDEAQKTAKELKEIIERGINRKHIRIYHYILGMIEIKRKNFAKAIEYLNESISLLPFQYAITHRHALFMDSLALAYFKNGDLAKAREEYGRIISLKSGNFLYGDIYAKSLYMLGKIYEQQGAKSKAIEHYEKFLGLWKDADPGTADVEDAKKRVAGLKNH